MGDEYVPSSCDLQNGTGRAAPPLREGSHMTAVSPAPHAPEPDRTVWRTWRTAWTAAHRPAAGVPRWARIAAYAVPFTVLPAGLWRIAGITFHLPIDDADQGSGDVPSWLPMELYVVLLSIFSELLAFAAVGLIARWGETFPRWIPGLGGKRVPTLAAVVPAALGATVLTVLWTAAAVSFIAGTDIYGHPITNDLPLHFDDWQGVLAIVSYAPLLLWGPILAVLTVAYYRRRR
jgi:hypothetical protein